MNKGSALALAAIAFAVGIAVGRSTNQTESASEQNAATEVVASAADKEIAGDVDRVKVPLGDAAAKGPADALINIVVFSDFQCPFCSRVNPTLETIMNDYKGKVRVFFRHYPLPFHSDAPLASQAALAAGEQGKFWEMHDKLFENQQALKRTDLERYAKDLKLDESKFKAALDKGTFAKTVEEDKALASKLGVRGTPNFFINGRPLSGAQPVTAFKTVIDDELERATKLIKAGSKKSEVYGKLMAAARDPATPAPSDNNDAPTPVPAPSDKTVYKIPLGDSPAQGGKTPKVTIVTFSEFQCPFCSRVLPTLKQVEDTYKDDVRVVFKHLPLPFHDNAKPAAQAAVAAHKQGKFWEMHDKMFANQQALTKPDLDRYAKEIGLNMGKFEKDFADSATADAIAADEKIAEQFGARGTPTFFINGRIFRGAQPFASFKAMIDDEIVKADELLKGGTKKADLYDALTKDGLTKVAAAAPTPGEPAAGSVLKVPVGDSPSKGPKDALVTLVQFSDYQCPFCSRVEPTIDDVMKAYEGKVRVVWKDLPLSFHNNAKPAAIAARAAEKQGKFWQMHAKLFENQQSLDGASLEKYAQEIGLNMAKFKADIASPAIKAKVEADETLAASVGARGTPATFVNGILLSGAQPLTAFKTLIDAELSKAEALVKKGTPKAKVYDEIMKTAGTAAAAPPAQQEAGPEEDKTVHKVTIGDAPARGPKNAPISIVVFSEFQCPFCSKVKPTLDAIEEEYKGKVRIAFKNYPLPFHNNAKPAAMAALAAHEQGKFWQMHDKLFENQQALDRPNLDKYAQEIGLDVGKFKSAMDSNKFAAQVEQDAKEGSAIGVTGTPATFINGRKISGAYPLPTFKAIVEQELAKTKKGG